MLDLSAQLAALPTLTVGELQAIYREVLGAPTRSYNKPHLQKRIAYQLQVQAEGGLSKKARQRIAILQGEDVTAQAPFRWSGAEAPALHTSPRDPRLPPAGSVIRRRYRGIDHEITVLDDGFVYQGTRYPNLSRIATAITGTKWNGYLFFRLQSRAAAPRRDR